jgi:hypothetical protein
VTEQPAPARLSAEARPESVVARWRKTLALAADFPRPESVGGSTWGRWILVGLAGSLALLSLLGVWSLPTWWAAASPYGRFGRWGEAFLTVAWSWYGLYTATGAWCLRRYPVPWVRHFWAPLFVGCTAISAMWFGFLAIRPGLT